MTNKTQYTISYLDNIPKGNDLWKTFLSKHPRATPYHTLAWKRSIERTFQYEPAYLLLTDEKTDDVIGAVPGFELREGLGTSLKNPFCEYGFPLLSQDIETESALNTLRKYGGGRSAVILKDCPFSGVDGYSQAMYGGVQTGVTHRLDIDLGFDRLLEDVFDDSLRRSARLLGESEITVEESDELEAYHSLYLVTMRRLGSPQFPSEFFESLRDEFGNEFHYHAATKDGNLVAGLVSLSHGNKLYLLSNGSIRAEGGPSFNLFLYLSVIAEACKKEYEIVDFGRTEPDSGVDQFKSHFGGTVLPLVSFVSPPHYVQRASVSRYKRLAPITRLASPLVTHPSIGPKLKRRIHE